MRACIVAAFCLLLTPTFALAQTETAATIIIEAQTTTPTFYNGRAEPSAGSTVRAVAILNGRSSENLRYRWELNGRLLQGDRYTGPTITFTAPLGNSFTLRVDIFDANETRIASDESYISISEPSVSFYESNLLQGLSRVAIRDTHILTSDEVTVRAEPYFMDRNLWIIPHELTWRVNGDRVQTDVNIPQNITLRNNGGSGTFLIEFALQNGVAIGQRVTGGFKLTF